MCERDTEGQAAAGDHTESGEPAVRGMVAPSWRTASVGHANVPGHVLVGVKGGYGATQGTFLLPRKRTQSLKPTSLIHARTARV
eukprot:3442939-Prymnesium_polylepis.1